jgi:hypothetical protein
VYTPSTSASHRENEEKQKNMGRSVCGFFSVYSIFILDEKKQDLVYADDIGITGVSLHVFNTLLSHCQSDGEGLNAIARVPKKEGVSIFRSSRKSGKNSVKEVECAETFGKKKL